MSEKPIHEIIDVLESDLGAGIQKIKDNRSLDSILETLKQSKNFQLSKELIRTLLEMDSLLVNDTEIRANLLEVQMENGFHMQDYEFAETNAKQELELRKQLGDGNKLATSYSNLATIYHVTGKITDAERYYHLAIDSCPEENKEDLEQYSFSFANLNQHYVGDFDKAIQYYQKAYDCARARGDESQFAFYIVHIAVAQKSKRLFDDALANFAQASVLNDDQDSMLGLYASFEQYETLRDAGRWGEAEKGFENLVSRFEAFKDKEELLASLYIYTAELMMDNRAGDAIEKLGELSGFKNTEEYIKKATELAENVFSKRVYIMGHILAYKYYKANEIDRAEMHLEKAESIIKSQNRKPWQNIVDSIKEGV